MLDNWHWIYLWGVAVVVNYTFWILKSLFDGGASGFDRAKSNRVDSTSGVDVKSKST